jgi:cell pole-organizing protein PopZ
MSERRTEDPLPSEGGAQKAMDAPGTGASGEPSMEDILASIRRILSDDENTAAPPPAPPTDVLVLDRSMMIEQDPPAQNTPDQPVAAPSAVAEPELAEPAQQSLVAPATAASAATSIVGLIQTLAAERSTHVSRNGPTIEDLVREEIRPVLKAWLDEHLPPLVERLVRAEIERVTNRAIL